MARPLADIAARGARRSVWTEHLPPPDLAAVVERGWIGHGGWGHAFRLAPDGCVDLVWDGERLTVHRPRTAAMTAHVSAAARNVGLRLRCGWARPILGRSLLAPSDDVIPLDDAAARGATAALTRGADPERRLELLADLVRERLARGPTADAAVLAALPALRPGGGGPREAIRLSGLPERELRRRFAADVGLGPKRLQRVWRVLGLLERRGDLRRGAISAAMLAQELGYADQAHMIRESRAVVGRSPGRLARA